MQDRIDINKENNKLTITIKAYLDEKKQKMLLIWIVLFSVCGLAIFSQFFENYDNGTKVFFGVYIAFWLFFEFKVIYAYRWRKLGYEQIEVEGSEIRLVKCIGKRGITQSFNKEDVKKVDFIKDENSKFVKSMNESYWNINKYHLVLETEMAKIPFAIDIEKNDVKKILIEIKNTL